MTSWHDYPAAILGRTERKLLDWFARVGNAGETWVDVGAHYGYTAIALSRLVGNGGRVFAFEPVIPTAGHLSRTRALNGFAQLTVVPVALGDEAGFNILSVPTVRGMAEDFPLGEAGWHETILVTSLDWLWERLAGADRRIHGVKIDVQGMEIAALRGMSGLLREFRPRLVVEVHRGVDRGELLGVIEAAGYAPESVPIDPLPGEEPSRLADDRSYWFRAG